MGKISDALEKSNKEAKNHHLGDRAPGEDPLNGFEVKIDVPKPQLAVSNKTPERQAILTVKKPPVAVNGLSKDLVSFHYPQGLEAEKIKILRTSILFPEEGTPPRTIMVTSAFPGEGKTFIASNLAISIAKGVEEHVLLMDCDMRRPSVHTRFGYGRVSGLTEHLSDDVDLSSLILKTPIDKLSILSGGKPATNPAELLSSKKMANLLEETKTRYADRYIVIDSPPPLLTAEASAIARRVDSIIVVVKCGKTPRKFVSDLIDKIGKEMVVGVVFNFADRSRGYNRYYNGYYAE